MRTMAATICLLASVAASSAGASDQAGDAPGSNQFGEPETIELILKLGKMWKETETAPFGVGDLSRKDGETSKEHFAAGDHRTGLGIDIRPLRKDRESTGVRWQDQAYDRAATQRLVDMLNATGEVERIVFGDTQIKGTKVYRGLDDHLHVTMKSRSPRAAKR